MEFSGNKTAGVLSAEEVAEVNARFEKAGALEIVEWTARTFGEGKDGRGGLVMTSSFGAESMCMVDLARRAVPGIPIVFVNTGYLFPETLAFMEEMREKYQLNVLEFHTKNDPVVWLTVHGEPDPRERRDVAACCGANKNPVMDGAMKALMPKAFLRGVRAGQTTERAGMKVLEWMERYGCWAVSPMLRWTSKQVYEYMQERDLPHHPLWEKGYASIGCNPITCTRPIGFGEDERAGRWAGSEKKECGINLDLGGNI